MSVLTGGVGRGSGSFAAFVGFVQAVSGQEPALVTCTQHSEHGHEPVVSIATFAQQTQETIFKNG